MIRTAIDAARAFPIRDPQSREAKRARELFDRAAALQADADKIAHDARKAREAVKDAREALTEHLQDAYRKGKAPTKEKALTDALRKAEARANEPWTERHDAARAAASAAYDEARRYAREHGLTLLEELRPEAEAAAARVAQAMEQMQAALDEYRDMVSRVTALVAYVPGLNGQDVENGSALGALRRGIDAMRIAGEVPVPHVKPQALAWARGEQERPTYDPTALR